MSKVLDAAQAAVKDRHQHYGSPLQNFKDIARLWTVALRPLLQEGAQLTPGHVAQLNRLQKEARLIKSPGHQDSLNDIVGYVLCHEEVLEEQAKVQPMQDKEPDYLMKARPLSAEEMARRLAPDLERELTSSQQTGMPTEPDKSQASPRR